MSDDDLWREPEPGQGEQPAEPGSEPASEPVSDETQPLTGPPPGPAPTPPGPSYQPPSGPGAVPPAHNPYGATPPPNPYAAPPQNPYAGQQGQPYAPPPNPYAAPNEYATPQSPYGAPFHPAYAGGAVPDHPSATTAMVLGIISLVGILFCGGLTLVLAPAAWVVGAKAVRQIDASPGQFAGRDRAQAGKIMGIIGSVLLVLGILAIIASVALLVSVGNSDPQPVFPSPSFGNGGA
jgi:hypothetical protein